MAHGQALVDYFSSNVREARTRRGLTQDELARLSGVPRSTISHVESGDGNPTLHVISALADALRLSIEEMLSPPRGGCQLFRAAELRLQQRGGVQIQKLLPHAITGMEIDRMTLRTGDRLTGTPHRPGTHEYLYCERGKLTLYVAGERFDLRAGDVAAFPGDQRHSYYNRGTTSAVGFSVVTLSPLSDESLS